jgi:hypothetical protein
MRQSSKYFAVQPNGEFKTNFNVKQMDIEQHITWDISQG